MAQTDEALPVEGEGSPEPPKRRRFPIKTLLAVIIVVALGLPVFSELGRH